MSVPTPQPGLVLSYAYLWAWQHEQGLEEGVKDRPCAIVAARQVIEGREVVTVVPITHSPPADPSDAIEIPPALKSYLGLDDLPSWVVVTETNEFLWPGPDLRPRRGITPKRFDYGILPLRFFAHIRDRCKCTCNAEQLLGMPVSVLTPNALPPKFRSEVLQQAEAL